LSHQQRHHANPTVDTKGALAIGLWYLVNISTVILNKWLFDNMQFGYPLLLTWCHMSMSYLLAFLVLRVFRLMPLTVVNSTDRFSKIAPLAYDHVPAALSLVPPSPPSLPPPLLSVIFILNIVLGNFSLHFVPVSFMQTVKSAVPAFTYLFQVVLAYRQFEVDTAASLIPVVFGVMLATWTEVNFNFIGFMCAIIASVTTAIQSIVSSFLLTGALKMDAVNLVYNLAPISSVLLFPFVIVFEWPALAANSSIITPYLVFLVALSSAVAFALNFSVFYAIKHTSTLTFTVAGNLKVVFVIAISVAIFRNPVSFTNALGIFTTIVGCWFYSGVQERHKLLAQKRGSTSV
jgi:solute carrier family 35 protein E3